MIKRFAKPFNAPPGTKGEEDKKKKQPGPHKIRPREWENMYHNDEGTQTMLTSLPATFIPAPGGYQGRIAGLCKRAKLTIGIDIDGVIADFNKLLREIAAQYVPVENEDEAAYKIRELKNGDRELEDKVMQEVYEKHRIPEAPPVPDAVAKINEIYDNGHRVIILTARADHWYDQTEEFLKKIGLKYHKLIHDQNKGARAQKEGIQVFIDDKPSNVEDLREHGVDAYLYDRPWNQDHNLPRIHGWKNVKAFIVRKFSAKPWEQDPDAWKGSPPPEKRDIQDNMLDYLVTDFFRQNLYGGDSFNDLRDRFFQDFLRDRSTSQYEQYPEAVEEAYKDLLNHPNWDEAVQRFNKGFQWRESIPGANELEEMFRWEEYKGFTKFSAPRWTTEEKNRLKKLYLKYRERGIPHHIIYKAAAELLGKSFLAVKQKLESMYDIDEDLGVMKYEHWDLDKINQTIRDLYTGGQSISRMSLPANLMYQITNHSLPKAETCGFPAYYDSFGHAMASNILAVGFERDGDKLTENSIETIEDALKYYRRKEKMAHAWERNEIVALLQDAHAAGLPLTYSFFKSHPDIYKPLIGVGRSLEGLRDSIRRSGNTWSDLVIEAAPEYVDLYTDDGRLKPSTEELRIRRFLELNNVPFRTAETSDKIAVTIPEIAEQGYKNFVPDFFILDDEGNTQAIVEVFGSVADSLASNTSELYREKKSAKEQFYQTLPYQFIAINNNADGIDLTDEILRDKFGAFIRG